MNSRLILTLLLFLIAVALPATGRSQETPIDFAREILPILSDTCFTCHGPDENVREADLRLDTRAGLLGGEGFYGVVVPGDTEASDLFWRITAEDESERMPPNDATRQLTPSQIELIEKWIQQGAPWSQHWAYEPIVRPTIHEIPHADSIEVGRRAAGSIDAWVQHQLEARGLTPSDRATKERLIRRVTLDLIGVPPTIEEIDAFVADTSPVAFERVVDRLLASPRYGERMAWDWLEAARYADTNGYQGDNERTMSPWRDWVIDSLNEAMPYDAFSIRQIAGDLLDGEDLANQIATGFCRNHMINGEGGRIPEENRVEYVFDQLETVGTIWLGMTYQCCRCHDHKYDALSQDNYYEMFAIFNQTPIDGGGGNAQTPPVVTAPSNRQLMALERLRDQLRQVDQQLAVRAEELGNSRTTWEREFTESFDAQGWILGIPISAGAEVQQLSILSDSSILAGGSQNPVNDSYTVTFASPEASITGIQLEALQHESLNATGLSRSESGNFVLTDIDLQVLHGDESPPLTVEFESASATFEQGPHTIATAIDDDSETGWAVWEGRLVDREHAAVLTFESPIAVPADAKLVLRLRHDSPHLQHHLGRFRIAFSTAPEPELQPEVVSTIALMQIPSAERSDADWERVRQLTLSRDDDYQRLAGRQRTLQNGIAIIESQFAKVMVMSDRDERRETFVLNKGLYNQRMHTVDASLLDIFPYDQADEPIDRLDLANWVMDQRNPLTARVTANRIWQQLFGAGLVKTPADFGVQGERPTHPELLDWLARELIESDWDVKHLTRLIVLSETYQQTAKRDHVSQNADPDNRWLTRGPRQRMPSWMLRDHALFVSGLLVEEIGGPSVKPYQPPGVWSEATFGNKTYEQDSGAALYRRSLYTFWRRIVGPTMFFDVAKRQTCTVDQSMTNTPLHALVTLNDVTYVEAARVFAERLLSRESLTDDERLRLAYRMVTSREAFEREIEVLVGRLKWFQAYYESDPDAAKALMLIGESASDEELDLTERAAWTNVCLLLLNLDESLSK